MWTHRSEESASAETDSLGLYDFFPITYILPGEYAIFVEVRQPVVVRRSIASTAVPTHLRVCVRPTWYCTIPP